MHDKNNELISLLQIRPASIDDCELMFRLQKLDGSSLDKNDVEQAARFDEYKNAFVAAEIQVVVMAEEAIGRLRIVRGEEIYVGGLQLLPMFRRKGVGTALIKDLIEEACRTKKTIRLEVFHENLLALKFYEKNGFKVIAENQKQKILLFGCHGM